MKIQTPIENPSRHLRFNHKSNHKKSLLTPYQHFFLDEHLRQKLTTFSIKITPKDSHTLGSINVFNLRGWEYENVFLNVDFVKSYEIDICKCEEIIKEKHIKTCFF